jgi:excisionase family DNA binding protein
MSQKKPTPAPPSGLLTEAEAARYLKLSARSVWTLRNSGRIRCVRPLPNAVRYRLEDLDAFVESLRSPPADSEPR